MSQRQFTEEHLQRTIILYQQGWGYERIAKLLGFSSNTIRRNLQQAGIRPHSPNSPILTPEQLAEAQRLYKEDWSLAQLAKRYGCSYSTMRRSLQQAGTVLRSREEALKLALCNTPNLEPSPFLVYLCFSLRGDGSVSREQPWRIQLSVVEKAFRDKVSTALRGIGVSIFELDALKPRSSTCRLQYKVTSHSRRFCEWYHSLRHIDWLTLGRLFPVEALCAWFEAEGTAYYNNRGSLYISFENTDRDFLEQVITPLLSDLGYSVSLQGPKWHNKSKQPAFRLHVLGLTPTKEAFLEQLKPCIKYPPYDYRKPGRKNLKHKRKGAN